MSEYMFATSRVRVPDAVAAKRDAIAREIDNTAGYLTSDQAGTGARHWGYCANRGNPFDRETAERIMAAWKAAGVGVERDPRPSPTTRPWSGARQRGR